MQSPKAAFLREDLFVYLNNVQTDTAAAWGTMNAHQMVEHLSDFFHVSTAKLIFSLVTPEAHLPKYREFLYSEKPFKENTKAPANVLGDTPMPYRYPDLATAIEKLQEAVAEFFNFFSLDPLKTTMHPAFGMLNFEEWVLLHYKHVTHHLRQFQILPPSIV